MILSYIGNLFDYSYLIIGWMDGSIDGIYLIRLMNEILDGCIVCPISLLCNLESAVVD